MFAKIKKTALFAIMGIMVIAPANLVIAGGKVVLYSAHKQAIIDAMIPRFEAKTGIKAEVIKAGLEISSIVPMPSAIIHRQM